MSPVESSFMQQGFSAAHACCMPGTVSRAGDKMEYNRHAPFPQEASTLEQKTGVKQMVNTNNFII